MAKCSYLGSDNITRRPPKEECRPKTFDMKQKASARQVSSFSAHDSHSKRTGATGKQDDDFTYLRRPSVISNALRPFPNPSRSAPSHSRFGGQRILCSWCVPSSWRSNAWLDWGREPAARRGDGKASMQEEFDGRYELTVATLTRSRSPRATSVALSLSLSLSHRSHPSFAHDNPLSLY